MSHLCYVDSNQNSDYTLGAPARLEDIDGIAVLQLPNGVWSLKTGRPISHISKSPRDEVQHVEFGDTPIQEHISGKLLLGFNDGEV